MPLIVVDMSSSLSTHAHLSQNCLSVLANAGGHKRVNKAFEHLILCVKSAFMLIS